jgi:hypothetical protein
MPNYPTYMSGTFNAGKFSDPRKICPWIVFYVQRQSIDFPHPGKKTGSRFERSSLLLKNAHMLLCGVEHPLQGVLGMRYVSKLPLQALDTLICQRDVDSALAGDLLPVDSECSSTLYKLVA